MAPNRLDDLNITRVPEHFSIIIEGNLSAVREREIITPGALAHMLGYLLSGQDTNLEAFRDFRMRVFVEPYMDQLDEG